MSYRYNNNQRNYQRANHQHKKSGFKFANSVPRQQNFNQNNNNNEFSYFCHKKYIVLDEQTKKGIIEQFTSRFRFGGVRYEELTDVNNLNPNYLISFDKTNKINCLLFITTFNNKKYSVFIIENNIYSVKFRFDASLYNGTLISGEISRNKKGCWVFYVNDMLYYMGNYVQQLQLSNRLEMCHDLLRNKYTYDDFMNVCHVQMKSYFIFNHLTFVSNDCRLIFHPEYSNNITYYYNVKINDTKENEEVVKDRQFKIKRKDENTYDMFIPETNKHFGLLGITSIEMSKYLTKQFEDSYEVLLRCKYSSTVNTWLPLLE